MENVRYRHKKTGNIYAFYGYCINTTNAQDQQEMALYERNGIYFVREKSEFHEKFEIVEG